MKHYTDREESYYSFENNDDFELDGLDSHKRDVRRKIEERMERRRLKNELEDYEGELDEDFDWGDQ